VPFSLHPSVNAIADTAAAASALRFVDVGKHKSMSVLTVGFSGVDGWRSIAPQNVLCGSHDPQMIRPDAARRLAEMINLHPLGYRTDKDFMGYVVD
jgi:hypothetical protein